MSVQKPYNSKKKIEDIETSINKILEPWGNKVYVFDFGHYYENPWLNYKPPSI